MIWFLIIVGLLIFAPGILILAGVGIAVVAIPFIVFFAVWFVVAYVIVEVAPQSGLLGPIVGFIAGIYAARVLVKRVTKKHPINSN